MKTLSIFVDESGDLGLKDKGKTYYIITLVFHDQDYDINTELNKLDTELAALKCPVGAVHTEPLIRREAPYEAFTPNERRAIFTKLFFFAKRCDIAKIARDISLFIRDNMKYFCSFDEVVLYYDNGQKQLSKILNTVLATELSNYDVRRVKPSEYRLFQVADLLCTIELLNKKIESGEQLSRSEQYVFHSKRDFKKDFLKKIIEKRFE